MKDAIEDIANSFPALESISAEVVADTAEGMLEMAKEFTGLEANITIKVPCTVEGLKACKVLSDDGYSVNVTLVFSVAQAILANKAGADYISPFVGRWEDQSLDGLALIERLNNLSSRSITYYNDGSANILAASIRDVRQVESCASRCRCCYNPTKVFWKMYDNILTRQGLELFQADWDAANKGRIMKKFNTLVIETTVSALDFLYRGRDIQRFWVLEEIARAPYFAFLSVLHFKEITWTKGRGSHTSDETTL